jgi:hypothetical protein
MWAGLRQTCFAVGGGAGDAAAAAADKTLL